MRGDREELASPLCVIKGEKLAADYAIKMGKEENLNLIELGSFRELEFGGSSI